MSKRRYRTSNDEPTHPFFVVVVGASFLAYVGSTPYFKLYDPGMGIVLAGLTFAILTGAFMIYRMLETVRERAALQRMSDQSDINDSGELDYRELEVVAAKVYRNLGYRKVKHTGQHSSTDGGVDVWMLNKDGDVEIVQCKQLSSRVGKPELIGFAKTMRQQHAVTGHFWAPGKFTQPAIDYASQNNILLYENGKIMELVDRASRRSDAILDERPSPNKLGLFVRDLGLTPDQGATLAVILIICLCMLMSLCFLVMVTPR